MNCLTFTKSHNPISRQYKAMNTQYAKRKKPIRLTRMKNTTSDSRLNYVSFLTPFSNTSNTRLPLYSNFELVRVLHLQIFHVCQIRSTQMFSFSLFNTASYNLCRILCIYIVIFPFILSENRINSNLWRNPILTSRSLDKFFENIFLFFSLFAVDPLYVCVYMHTELVCW